MRKKILFLLVFALAMGYLEASVVIYLRDLYYPEGFDFPLKSIDLRRSIIEVAREAATVIMLLGLSVIAEKTSRGRFACFMFIFGLWDIAYYFWLWVTLSWPASLFTWDVLFLIPLIWTGPVIAPVMVALLLVVTSLLYYTRRDKIEDVAIHKIEWMGAIAAACLILVAFVFNHGIAYRGGVPPRFPWEFYAAGMAIAILLVIRVLRRAT